MMNISKYTCFNCDSYYCSENSICKDAVKCFTSRSRDSYGTETFGKGCIQSGDHVTLICASSFVKKDDALMVNCCDQDFCNNGSYPEFPFTGPTSKELAVYIILATLLVVVSCCFFFYVLVSQNRRCRQLRDDYLKRVSILRSADKHGGQNHRFCNGNKMLADLSSGSGSGVPLLIQRTFSKNISLEEIIGKGRYGEVWRGVWQGERIAVKIFSTVDEGAWEWETEVYSTTLLPQENILAFYGSDKTCRASCTQLWLITQYHPNGSLSNYLQEHILDVEEFRTLSLSLISGLLHLHTEIAGTQGKPAIAHRDITSRNILVKEDGSCCLSDFGLAAIRTPGTGEINFGKSERSFTARYLSPEVLDGTFACEIFDSFRQSDIYSISLVLWEIGTRVAFDGVADSYSLPFSDVFDRDPSWTDMYEAVCVKNVRPVIPPRWAANKMFSDLSQLLQESWNRNVLARLSAFRIKKDLQKMFAEYRDSEDLQEIV